MITSRNNAVETTQLQNLSLHVLHASAKVEHQVITKSIYDVQTTLKSVSLSWGENYVHLLICEMILKELLILKRISGTCYHAHIKCLNQNLHGHYRMRVASIKDHDRLYPIPIDQSGQLEKK